MKCVPLRLGHQPFYWIVQEAIGQTIFVDPKGFYQNDQCIVAIDNVSGFLNRYVMTDAFNADSEHKRLVYCLDFVWSNVVNRIIHGRTHSNSICCYCITYCRKSTI